MSWWGDLTRPVNDALNSTVFKAMFPVQALAQKLTQGATALTGLNHGQGLNPADQYAAGAAGGSTIAGAGALAGAGSGAGAGASGMTPYMPTSAPNMGMAGSTLGGGMGSPLNLGGSMGASGAGAAGGTSHVMQALQAMRGMGGMGGQQPQQANPQDVLQQLYKMFPKLRPGSSMGGGYGA